MQTTLEATSLTVEANHVTAIATQTNVEAARAALGRIETAIVEVT